MLFVIKSLFGYIRPYKLLSFLFFLTLALDLLFLSLAPLSFQMIIDKAIVPKDMHVFTVIMMVLTISGIICVSAGMISDYVLAKLSARVQNDLRQKLFAHMQHLPVSYFHKTRSGELVSHFSVDLPVIDRSLAILFTTGIQSLAVVTITTMVLFYLEWGMALCILAGAILIFSGPYLLGRRAYAVNAAYKEQLAAMMNDVQENAKAQMVIKGFNLQAVMIDKFNERLKLLLVSNYRKNLMAANLERIPALCLLLINFTIIGFGSYLALTGRISVGSLVAFFTMYTSMGNAVFNLTFTLPLITDTQVSMERIQKVLNEPSDKVDHFGAEQFDLRTTEVSVKNVTFGYQKNQLSIKQVNMQIPARTKVAIVGSSGSGKSTIVQLLLGLYEPSSGQIEINGTKLDECNRGAFRNHVGVVFQDNFLFHGTIADNIRLGKLDATKEELRMAAQQAEIHDFIMSLPDEYETLVLDGGSNLSGGQRQRLAIARAILRNPSLLILDEATSALDPISEASINRTFAKLSSDRTVITVTHRLATITDMDQIFVLEQGELVEQGTHVQLLQKRGYYRRLWDKQSVLTATEGVTDVLGVSMPDILHLFHTETFTAGQTIIREGEAAEKVHFLARGKVEVSQKSAESEEQIRLAILEDGDHFGETVLAGALQTTTVTALTSCVVLTLPLKVYQYITSQHSTIGKNVQQPIR
ncbi:ABC transporter transmembrane domain-containing protein [Brevibacillus formosus]|uniref:ABC transporter ATP-binding protein n=1 Tax=Brevibacillus formosus TaxID=54913 RepID=A0A837KLM9_9BACL|nr:ABC transporter transmembrane domain-containing protein [Brevibacillus formosus]KLH98617.1 ABC transporter ATP-binding protein [Brevibacillus formosus]MED1957937.1 ABC transporter transmembrane domain-containing protein [Brevibacillus formosus]PSJ88417.1 ABC transporter ATP-binding protein [Brevibacillus formosus]GED60872.1 multidrug ABC transporter ATP-binding protein [Brevibacillus formosus]